MSYSYSIIIPHYNIPELLERLLKSIPEREDTQIIVVDDCSSEESYKKLEDIRGTFPKVEFYSTGTNGGGGKARNVGLSHAKGRYVIFADADDFFTPEFNDILNTYSRTDEYDIIFFNNKSVDAVTLQPAQRVKYLSTIFELAKTDRAKAEMVFRFLFGEPWCKIISRRMIEEYSIRFDETPIHNDTRFSYLIGFYAFNVKVDSRIGYCITERPDSVSKMPSDEKLIIRLKVFAKKNRFFRKNEIPFIDPLMFSPFAIAIRSRNLKLLRKLFKEAKNSGYSTVAVIKNYLRYRKTRNGM